ncbi:MAG: hypothetical protein AAF471_03975 [Myxococcota bacterium]
MTIPSTRLIHSTLAGLSIAVMLTMTAACGGDTAMGQNLAVTAQGQWRTDARDGNVCSPDTPMYRNRKCYNCKHGYALLNAGVCRPNCAEGYEKVTREKYTGSKTICYKKQKGFKYLRKSYNKCDSCPKFYSCKKASSNGYKCKVGCPKSLKTQEVYYTKKYHGRNITLLDKEASFCYSNSYDTASGTPSDPPAPGDYAVTAPDNIKANCEPTELATCGGGEFSHCTIRSPQGREICVWNLPESGYPTCKINGNKATCHKTE